MVFKDWLLLLIPIFLNGVIVFVLQKLFEKKQIIRMRKMEYISILLKKIDESLGLHAKITRLANECNPNSDTISDTIRQYFDSNLDLYYYYIQNKNIFQSLKGSFENISTLIMSLTKSVNNPSEDEDDYSISSAVNSIRDILIKIKDICIKL